MAQTKTAASTKSKASKAAAPKAAAKPAAKKAPAKAAAKTTKKPAGKAKAGEAEVSLDRRRVAERRDEVATVVAPAAEKQPVTKQPVAKPAGLERREKVSRRRQIDPTTCERDYSDSEVEFMNALDAYKRRSGRMFPTCSEVLEVIHEIGYVRLTAAETAMLKAGRGEVDQTVEDLAETEAREALAESEALRGE